MYLTNYVLSLGTATAVGLVVMHSGKYFLVKNVTGKSSVRFYKERIQKLFRFYVYKSNFISLLENSTAKQIHQKLTSNS